jgi:hypothetical protein
LIKQLIFKFSKLLNEFKTKSNIEFDEFYKRLGAFPDLKNVLKIENKNWLIPSTKVVSSILKVGYETKIDFDMLKSLIASSKKE